MFSVCGCQNQNGSTSNCIIPVNTRVNSYRLTLLYLQQFQLDLPGKENAARAIMSNLFIAHRSPLWQTVKNLRKSDVLRLKQCRVEVVVMVVVRRNKQCTATTVNPRLFSAFDRKNRHFVLISTRVRRPFSFLPYLPLCWLRFSLNFLFF